MQPQHNNTNGTNLIIAIALSTAILFAWQYFYAEPLREQQEAAQLEQELKEAQPGDTAPIVIDEHLDEDAAQVFAETVQKQNAPKKAPSPRVEINAKRLHGSLALRGGRIDSVTLADYYDTVEKTDEVKLLSEQESALPYFAEFGWLAGESGVNVPSADTMWSAEDGELTSETPLVLHWTNGQGLRFTKTISVDENYMFTVKMGVQNASGADVTLYPYGLLNRAFTHEGSGQFILHEGPLGVVNQTLEEISYDELREDGPVEFKNTKGWVGITDKYWLTALLPSDNSRFSSTYQFYNKNSLDRYQVDMRGGAVSVKAGEAQSYSMQFFAGAKEVALLDEYAAEYNIPLFDRAVDFGMLYFLTRPIFELLTWFHAVVGNFGLAIMALTVLIKLIMFPLANKSYVAMSQMKLLMPKIQELRERHKDEPMRMNQEMMALYRQEKVNPMSGCLPILVQLPVFFALYKVLFVTIEMRHTPFYGWIADLSAPDPTNVFTLLGLFEWGPPSFLHIGVWPVLMCITMILQQKLNPKPTDPMQAKVIAWMPYIFLFLFATFPAGLVIYWTWNNTLSVIQQAIIMKRYKKKTGKK